MTDAERGMLQNMNNFDFVLCQLMEWLAAICIGINIPFQ